ncbi:MAG: tRNA (N6-isopentenyl adenosine(37)-C2)-methylthiotransferase MiaB [Holosporaceae bacterium]|jgi:tRNA-2-methylthio-N6-dimethylallyladenosine synthase|nr:tRNA (N6-isopentenyl adenosine(37)-C2)-methylthiotransferase MiaB [Holosporaceae bacterium]
MRQFFIKSYGCQMNSYDSQRIADALLEAGYESTASMADANVVIFNTCSIREKADEKLFSDLGRARLQKLEAQITGNDFIIVVTGCVAQSKSEDIAKRAPYVDVIAGPQEIHKITEDIKNFEKNNRIIRTESDAKNKFWHLTNQFFNREVSEFLTIQEGCNNFCTYCVVPYTRGPEFSRDAADIIAEAKKLLSLNVKEIILLGQNVNSYRGTGTNGKTWDLSRLIFALADLDGLKRLRYTTSNPKDVNENIAKAHGEVNILMPFVHLPVQSGSDAVLQRMNRKYSADQYKKCVDLLRDHQSNIAFSSDFIVGFPGETDEDFQKTLDLVEKIKFAQAYSFKYSPRPGTAAEKMLNQVPEEKKSERLQILQKILNDQQSSFNNGYVGQYLNVLISKCGRHKNQLVGRSEYSQSVAICDSYLNIGDVARVKITAAMSHSLVGVVM